MASNLLSPFQSPPPAPPTAPPGAPPNDNLLLRLPLEIRNQIYGYVYPVNCRHQNRSATSSPVYTGLLTTSKQIAAEAADVLYSNLWVFFDLYTLGWAHASHILTALPWNRLQRLYIRSDVERRYLCESCLYISDSEKCKMCEGSANPFGGYQMLLVTKIIENLSKCGDMRTYIGITIRHDNARVLRFQLLMLLDKAQRLAHFRRVTIRVEGPSDAFSTRPVFSNPQSNPFPRWEMCDEEIVSAVMKIEPTLGPMETKVIDHDHRRLVFQLAAGRP